MILFVVPFLASSYSSILFMVVRWFNAICFAGVVLLPSASVFD